MCIEFSFFFRAKRPKMSEKTRNHIHGGSLQRINSCTTAHLLVLLAACCLLEDWRASTIMQATSLLLAGWVVALCVTRESTQLAECPTHDGAAAASFEGRPVYSLDDAFQ